MSRVEPMLIEPVDPPSVPAYGQAVQLALADGNTKSALASAAAGTASAITRTHGGAGLLQPGAPVSDPLRCGRAEREGQRLAVRPGPQRLVLADRLLEADGHHVVRHGCPVGLQRRRRAGAADRCV